MVCIVACVLCYDIDTVMHLPICAVTARGMDVHVLGASSTHVVIVGLSLLSLL